MAFPREKCISVFQSGTPRTPLLRFPSSTLPETLPFSVPPFTSGGHGWLFTDGKSHRIDPLRLESIIRPFLRRGNLDFSAFRFTVAILLYFPPLPPLPPPLLPFRPEKRKSLGEILERERKRKGWNRSRDISRCVAVANEGRILIRIEGRGV